jgi:hypothetical protein
VPRSFWHPQVVRETCTRRTPCRRPIPRCRRIYIPCPPRTSIIGWQRHGRRRPKVFVKAALVSTCTFFLTTHSFVRNGGIDGGDQPISLPCAYFFLIINPDGRAEYTYYLVRQISETYKGQKQISERYQYAHGTDLKITGVAKTRVLWNRKSVKVSADHGVLFNLALRYATVILACSS